MTSSITWTPKLPPFDHGPDDIKDFVFDFEAWLGDDVINAGQTTALAENCEAVVAATTDTTATLRVFAGGPQGTTGSATLRLRTANGRQSDRSLRFRFKHM